MTTQSTQRSATTDRPAPSRPSGRDYVGIYLNDHLAGATSGMGLARRMAGTAEPGSQAAGTLRRLTAEIVDDRQALISMMTALGVPVRGYKVFGAWAGEKAGRLKFNGHLLTRSPLTEVVEAEILLVGVAGKAAGWRMLRRLAERDSRLDAARLDDLLARADRQREELESLRISALDSLIADDDA
jgi:hypothetical protein